LYSLDCENTEIIIKKFGGKEKISTFAVPFEKRVLERGIESSLKRLITVQEASTEKNNLSRSVNSFERIKSDELSRHSQGVCDILDRSYRLVMTEKI